jgi:hypothetical protein
MANTHDVPGSSAPTARLQVDPRYQELTRQHHSLDERLHSLASQPYLTDAQHLEELTLKKKKLAIKDQIAALTAAERR